MMGQPVENLFGCGARGAWRQFGSVDHNNRQVQGACRMNFGLGPLPAGVFANHQINLVVLEQSHVTGRFKRATRHDNRMVWQGWRCGRGVNQAQHVVVLGLGGKGIHMQTTQGQHDALRGAIQGCDRAIYVWHQGPIVTRLGLPRRARQGNKGRFGCSTGAKSIPAHLRGKGMRRVNYMGDVAFANICGQAVRSTKPTHTMGDRLAARRGHTPGIGKHRWNVAVCHRLGQIAGLGCATKNKEMHRHV